MYNSFLWRLTYMFKSAMWRWVGGVVAVAIFAYAMWDGLHWFPAMLFAALGGGLVATGVYNGWRWLEKRK